MVAVGEGKGALDAGLDGAVVEVVRLDRWDWMARMVAWVWRGDDGAVGGRLGWQTGGAEGGMVVVKKRKKA